MKKEQSVKKKCIARAFSSTANLGPGFDIFGLSLDLFYDDIKIQKKDTKNGLITITQPTLSSSTATTISDGNSNNNNGKSKFRVPDKVNENSSGLVAKKMLNDFGIKDDIEIEIQKGVPAGFGVGSSAASSAATAYGINFLYELNLEMDSLVKYAAEGELASAGVKHYDNVSGALMGGFVITRKMSEDIEFIKIDPPDTLKMILAIPEIKVPEKKTEAARSVLPKIVEFEKVIANLSNASTIVAGFALKDTKVICKGIHDLIVEPARKHLIPNFDNVKKNAINSGALAFTISGAGPSVIAFFEKEQSSLPIINAVKQSFAEVGVNCMTYECKPSKGAEIIYFE